jgi:hypothetical protein
VQVGDDIISTLCLKCVAECLSPNESQVIVWNATADNNVVYLTAQLQSPAVFNEYDSVPQWGTLYHSMKSVSGTGSNMIRFFHSLLVI